MRREQPGKEKIKKRERSTERIEYVKRRGDMEKDQSIAEKAMEKVDVLHKMVVKMEGKIKKLESMVESMLRTHNEQMDTLITELKDNGKRKGIIQLQ